MNADRPDELFVGVVALALVPLIAWRIWRGLRDGRLPLYRTSLARDDGARFTALLVLHILSFVMAAVIAADLLLGLGLRQSW